MSWQPDAAPRSQSVSQPTVRHDFTGLPACSTLGENTITRELDDFTHNKSLNSSINDRIKLAEKKDFLKKKNDRQSLAHLVTVIKSYAVYKHEYQILWQLNRYEEQTDTIKYAYGFFCLEILGDIGGNSVQVINISITKRKGCLIRPCFDCRLWGLILGEANSQLSHQPGKMLMHL